MPWDEIIVPGSSVGVSGLVLNYVSIGKGKFVKIQLGPDLVDRMRVRIKASRLRLLLDKTKKMGRLERTKRAGYKIDPISRRTKGGAMEIRIPIDDLPETEQELFRSMKRAQPRTEIREEAVDGTRRLGLEFRYGPAPTEAPSKEESRAPEAQAVQ
jgi:hypothetical protein